MTIEVAPIFAQILCMDSLHHEKFYNGEKDYIISVIEENDGVITTTIREIVDSEREVAVFRKKEDKYSDVRNIVADAKTTISSLVRILPKVLYCSQK